MTYKLVAATANQPVGILCLLCESLSYNAHDVGHLYCGHCHIFHELVTRWRHYKL